MRVVINANYAIDAGLDPVKDPIAVESGENNPYANYHYRASWRREEEGYRRIGRCPALKEIRGLDPY